MEIVDRRLLAVAVISATVVALSITIGVVGGEVSSTWLWVLLVPVGLFGAGLVAVASFGILVARRLRS